MACERKCLVGTIPEEVTELNSIKTQKVKMLI